MKRQLLMITTERAYPGDDFPKRPLTIGRNSLQQRRITSRASRKVPRGIARVSSRNWSYSERGIHRALQIPSKELADAGREVSQFTSRLKNICEVTRALRIVSRKGRFSLHQWRRQRSKASASIHRGNWLRVFPAPARHRAMSLISAGRRTRRR